ncbi:BatD family protein [Xanthomonas albilineans]|uniref:BatD family protein n=1 Tax=Xanthomonas albilineans TaxID=29447 RepID=UPI0005F31518|nr:BatD family protein [Xanthomonas albilineans]
MIDFKRHCRGAHGVALLLLVALLLTVMPVAAATRAWLDRDSVSAGEGVTLNIETDQTTALPDYAPLRAQFILSNEIKSRQVQVVNGMVSVKALFGVMLTPRSSGTLQIPSLRVGNEQTAPLRLQVAAAAAAAAAPPAGATAGDSSALGDADIFVQTQVDDAQPYVQQSVGVVVRLYLGVPLNSGELDLQAPAGAALQRIGDDIQSRREINGRMYTVIERHYLLVPERSGPLLLPGARFVGHGPSGLFDDDFFGRGGDLNARSAAQTLQVRAQPADAPQPWLPLHALRLRYTVTPQRAKAGEAADIVVEAHARGATQAQFPELPTPSADGAQVFAEPPQVQERFVDGGPELTITRRYSIVPQNAGPLLLHGLQMPWWDVAAGAAREAVLPDLTLQVQPGQGVPALPPPVSPTAPALSAAPADSAVVTSAAQPAPFASVALWMALALGFALLWFATLVWAWRRVRRARTAAAMPAMPVAAAAPPPPRASLAELRKALDSGGLDEVVMLLCAQAGVSDLDALVLRLGDTAQREAVLRMQRARWSVAGDVPGARAALRAAFASGPHWREQGRSVRARDDLPPLYPRDA